MWKPNTQSDDVMTDTQVKRKKKKVSERRKENHRYMEGEIRSSRERAGTLGELSRMKMRTKMRKKNEGERWREKSHQDLHYDREGGDDVCACVRQR